MSWHIYSTLTHLTNLGVADGERLGVGVGASRQLGTLITRAAKRAFGPPSDEQRTWLEDLVLRQGQAQLEQMRDRLPDATGWASLIQGIEPPAEPPREPDYLVPFEIDLEPMPPSIDEFAEFAGPGGVRLVVHFRMQRLYQSDIGAAVYKENRRVAKQQGCRVESAVLLLWDGADGPAMTGAYEVPDGGTFRYNLTRIWERDVDEMLLNHGVAYLAPLAKGAPERLPEIVKQMEAMIEDRAKTDEQRRSLWLVAYGSMGLRYSAERVHEVLAHRMPELYQMEEFRRMRSRGYQTGFTRSLPTGALEATRAWVLALGPRRLGEPPAEVHAAINAIRSLDRLEQLASRVLKATDWPAVLAAN